MISVFTLSDLTRRTNRRAGQSSLAQYGICELFVSKPNKQTLLLLHSHRGCVTPQREKAKPEEGSKVVGGRGGTEQACTLT